MSRPVIVDFFCCEGGAGKGYHDAGFDVIGVDIDPQPLYPFPFIQADVLDVLDDMAAFIPADVLARVVAAHASPPCQHFSTSTASTGNVDNHPDLIEPTRRRLDALGLPYVMENVGRAPLRRDLMLCGSMFGLRVRRHRIFELGGWSMTSTLRCDHVTQRAGGRVVDVTGHPGGRNQTLRPGYPIKFYDAEHGREVMGMPWASARGCAEAIPPVYAEHIGVHLMRHLEET